MESRTEMHAWTSGRAAGGWGAVAAIAAGLLMMACGGPRAVTEPDPAAQYRAAIADARTAEPSEIATTLTPLVPYNDALVWRAPPQVTTSTCRASDRTDNALRLRLAQRLGLPPDADYDRFVELWVRPRDLVRPCPDPEVTDRECELRPPKPQTHVPVSDAHQDWFRELKATSYGPDGYPFTGLGYTYDWHPATDEVGPSEFVLRPGESGIVRATYSTAAYCDGSG